MRKKPSTTSDGSAAIPSTTSESPGAAQGAVQSALQESDARLEPKDLIDILMKEYETLREEITHRMNTRFGIVGFVGAVVVFVLTQLKTIAWPELIWPLSALAAPKQVVWSVVILVLSFFFLLALWWRLGTLIKNCSLRIAEIERTVNHLAGHELLLWETRQQASGLFHKVHRS